MSKNKTLIPVILIISLFFLWGFAHNLNPILIPHLKKACQLSDLQSALIDSSFFIAYFAMALPAGYFMKKYGYKYGIIIGLVIFALGAFLFYPAASTRNFSFFLIALFVIASGLTFLETAANPYISVLGDPETATQRLNFAQSFNGLAATLAPLLGGMFILSGKHLSAQDEQNMSLTQLNEFLTKEASSVQIPYIIIGVIVLTVAVVIWRTNLPEIAEPEDTQHQMAQKHQSIFKEKNLMLGVLAQFFYVGAQVCVSSFFIRFAGKVAGIEEKSAAYFLSAALLGFMIGRFFGTFLMKYIAPSRLLAIYAVTNIVLLLIAIFADGYISVYALIGVEFFMSIMFPTIFSLSIQGLGAKTKKASSFLIMSIVGGAIFPLIMGRVSDASTIQLAYSIPALCFLVVFYFAIKNAKVTNITMVSGH
ncbi:MAG: L-fucose:H+ symporter permease [Sphingobacteriales bacterium]|jgi:MFS transporter, FHS family, L-fucose permease|nr:MAG: L-fucose:H+ symporter permease [Sphingobacteriales bacterium]